MDFGKAFTYVFEDKNWMMKVLIGGLISLIPIAGAIIVLGYMLTTLKNVADGQAEPLPEWSQFGDFFMKGLYAFVGALIYFLPAILLYCCVIILGVVASGAAGGTAATSNSSAQAAGGAVATVVSFLTICLNCVLALYALVAGLTLYAPLTRFAMSANQLSLFWDFRGNFAFIQKNAANYVIALVVAWVAGIVGGFGIILCIIGVIFTYFWSSMVGAHAFGQMWRLSQGQNTGLVG